MKNLRKYLITTMIMLIVVYLLVGFRLPYYIYRPGSADVLEPIVKVDDGYKSKGSMHMVTVSGGQATLLGLMLAKMTPHNEILPIDEVRPKGITNDQYRHAQIEMMEGSQEKATIVGYKAAGADIEIKYKGVYVVSAIKGMPAYGKLKKGDLITSIDGTEVKSAEDLMRILQDKQAGDKVQVDYKRGKKKQQAEIQLKMFNKGSEKAGLGIQLVTDRELDVDPKIHFSSGDVGGPSAGLMFSLEIYDQLTKKDLTGGHEIAGTGEISYEGDIEPIGGIDKKVIAADQQGIEIFFAPNEHGKENSNYKVAKATADEIGTKMKIVPVDTFKEALNYLEKLPPKK
ncbi:SepM family pheromone-processing serine protease [Aciduricibacillus chroicocephali]|uniref:endopeptidase La n=1 Tax=Aciduricibacillus chroicocephali TaxID=3054939 RepID=A0ABY9L1J3_9BACI|nr:SepM family pheromone-processing serine protease [Bacillaceae bacterium 44XB]